MATENPLGIGQPVFGPIYGEDTHNIWLKALLDCSWLGFAACVAFVFTTLGLGLKVLLRDPPSQLISRLLHRLPRPRPPSATSTPTTGGLSVSSPA